MKKSLMLSLFLIIPFITPHSIRALFIYDTGYFLRVDRCRRSHVTAICQSQGLVIFSEASCKFKDSSFVFRYSLFLQIYYIVIEMIVYVKHSPYAQAIVVKARVYSKYAICSISKTWHVSELLKSQTTGCAQSL